MPLKAAPILWSYFRHQTKCAFCLVVHKKTIRFFDSMKNSIRLFMKTILLHLERLQRHYDIAVHTYDHIALLDLSHSLRIWVDMKNSINDIAPKFSTTRLFKTESPARKLTKAARASRFVFSYMPGGVITYNTCNNNGGMVFDDHVDYYDKKGIFQEEGSFGFNLTYKGENTFVVHQYCIVNKELGDNLLHALNEGGNIKRCNYIQWLGSEVVKMSYPNSNGILESLSIFREIFIKRMANTFDGSHPSIAKDEDNYNNKFDEPIRSLLHHRLMGGLPLPYFILLKIAQDILEIAPHLLKSQCG